jgi:hypothetical protein
MQRTSKLMKHDPDPPGAKLVVSKMIALTIAAVFAFLFAARPVAVGFLVAVAVGNVVFARYRR